MSASFDGVRTLDAAHVAAARALRDRGLETPSLDARVLLCHATGLSHERLIAHGRDPLAPEAAARLAGYVTRRLKGEPVSRIKGVREFYGRDFRIDPHTLDPRPDTETLIGAALRTVAADGLAQRPMRVLDLGTGSGCILVTLLAELPLAEGTGTDTSACALRMAAENAARLGVGGRARFLAADWFEGLTGRFDLIVANPPYIASGEIEGLAREVAGHDPMRALDGGPDGLEAYRRIAARAGEFLGPGGHLLVEIGPSQAQAVLELFRAAGLIAEADGVLFDLGGRPRCVQAESPLRGRAEGRRPAKISLENRDVRGSFEVAN
jgi:release factor glutamine methyltransferase